jgi:CHAD domain-containing protein
VAELATHAARRPPRRRRGGLDFLLGYAIGQRLEAQATLEQAVPDEFAVDRLTAELLHTVRRPESGPDILLDLARPSLAERLEDVNQAAAADLTSYDNLHQVRIAGKRLRYAMEVFAGCFDAEFRTVHYAAVEEMQEILGRTNDSHVACLRVSRLRDQVKATLPDQWKRFRSDFDDLLHFHEQRLAEGLPAFEKWWHRWQDSGGEAALMRTLQPAVPMPAPVDGAARITPSPQD